MTATIPVFQGMANTWECDENGHLNVRYYAQKVEEGLAHLYHRLGLTRAVQQGEGARMRIRDQHIHYKREVRPGEGLYGLAGLLSVGEDRLRIYVELINGHTDVTAAIFNIEAEYRSLEDHRLLPLPRRVKDSAGELVMPLPDYAAPRSIPIDRPSILDTAPPALADTEDMGLHEITRGQVLDGECDATGHMHAFLYLGRISDGVVHLARHFRPKDTGKTRSLDKYGGAVLEYRLRYGNPLRAGDLLVIRSGLAKVGEKANNVVHWTFNAETGELVSTAEAVGITLDLEARKIVPMPEERRKHLEGLIIPDLSM